MKTGWTKIARQILAVGVACCIGVMLPVLANLYSHAAMYHGTLFEAWHDINWRYEFISGTIFLVQGSSFVGLTVGGVSVLLLRLMGLQTFWWYILAGACIGAFCGILATSVLHVQGDPVFAWGIFTVLPALSMACGFITYWFIGVRGQVANPELVGACPPILQ